MEWLTEHVWVVWMSIAAILGVTELLTLDFTLLMLAGGALAGGAAALLFPGLLWVQILAAVVVAVAMLGLLRPTLLRRVRALPGYRSSVDKMVGSPGVALTEVTAATGEVKVSGEVWSAHSLEGSIPAGTEVEVYRIDGAIAIVYPRNIALP
ncbi:MAG: NfeD family protein [Actinobacteria bacterium]|uniref:NfeD family protein n=1 Tax=Propionicimonas sp. T2.31MG-18 TaxID=3157620 RepID=UPI0035EBC7C0|nr:NfeD family protein [Actinomycetota bacterium]